MTTKLTKRLIREGDFVAEVDVHLVEEEGGWSPCLSLEDTGKLDAVRDALRAGDITCGAQLATRLYRLTPVEARARPTSPRRLIRLTSARHRIRHGIRHTRRPSDGVLARVSQTAVYDTC